MQEEAYCICSSGQTLTGYSYIWDSKGKVLTDIHVHVQCSSEISEPKYARKTRIIRIFVYSCFDKGCPTEKLQSIRDNTERHDGLWLFTVASSSSRVFSAMEGGAMNTCLHVLKETKWILRFQRVH